MEEKSWKRQSMKVSKDNIDIEFHQFEEILKKKNNEEKQDHYSLYSIIGLLVPIVLAIHQDYLLPQEDRKKEAILKLINENIEFVAEGDVIPINEKENLYKLNRIFNEIFDKYSDDKRFSNQ